MHIPEELKHRKWSGMDNSKIKLSKLVQALSGETYYLMLLNSNA